MTAQELLLKVKSVSPRQGRRICAANGVSYDQLVNHGKVVERDKPDNYTYSKGEWV